MSREPDEIRRRPASEHDFDLNRIASPLLMIVLALSLGGIFAYTVYTFEVAVFGAVARSISTVAKVQETSHARR